MANFFDNLQNIIIQAEQTIAVAGVVGDDIGSAVNTSTNEVNAITHALPFLHAARSAADIQNKNAK